jgi:uncharacterized YigZ family protein
MDDADRIRTLARPHRVEVEKVKGSRFVADAAPAADDTAALSEVERVRAAFPDATHHCWAFRLEGGRERADDDGEPRDTAGAPILRHIQGADLVDVVVVVTRWFGGTKLGRGGLVRAYGAATAAVLDDAPIVERPVVARFSLAHDYDLTGPVASVLAAHGATIVDATHGARVVQHVTVPRSGANAFVAAMAEATAGRVVPVTAG